MQENDFPFSLIKNISFQSRPYPLPADLRPLHRIIRILAVLHLNCRSNTASLLQIQFFNWVLKNAYLQEVIESGRKFSLGMIHMDPVVNIALRIAIADDLIQITSTNNYKLTKKGLSFINKVLSSDPLPIADDLKFLQKVKKKISDVKLRGKSL